MSLVDDHLRRLERSYSTMRRASILVRYGLIGEGLYIGLGYALGPSQWTSSPSLTYVREIGNPRLWGAIILVTAVGLIVDKTRWWGYVAGTVIWSVLTVLLALAIPITTAWAGPATFGFSAMMHLVGAMWTRR